MNQKGYSWPEAMLTLVIIMVVFGTLLPLGTHLLLQTEKKKINLHSAETIKYAALLYTATGAEIGERTIDHITYRWAVSENAICVTTNLHAEELVNCIDY